SVVMALRHASEFYSRKGSKVLAANEGAENKLHRRSPVGKIGGECPSRRGVRPALTGLRNGATRSYPGGEKTFQFCISSISRPDTNRLPAPRRIYIEPVGRSRSNPPLPLPPTNSLRA